MDTTSFNINNWMNTIIMIVIFFPIESLFKITF